MQKFSEKRILIAVVLVMICLCAVAVFYSYWNRQDNFPKDISKATNKQIIGLLEKNKDGANYIAKYPDFRVDKKMVLDKDSIIAGQSGQNFKEVYQGLELENNRYMRVDLMNQSGDRGLIAVLDFKTQQTVKAYGVVLVKSAIAPKK